MDEKFIGQTLRFSEHDMECLGKSEIHPEFPEGIIWFFLKPLTLLVIKFEENNKNIKRAWLHVVSQNWGRMEYREWHEIHWYQILVDKSHCEINGAKGLKTHGVMCQGPDTTASLTVPTGKTIRYMT